jgi:hypothetical protein
LALRYNKKRRKKMGKVDLYHLIYKGFKELIEDFMGDRKFKISYGTENEIILKNFVIYVEYQDRIFKILAQKSFSGDSGWDYRETEPNELIENLENEFEKFKDKVLEFERVNDMSPEELKDKYFSKMGLKKLKN